MSRCRNQDRVEPEGFQAGSEEHGNVHAGSKFLLHHRLPQTHPLRSEEAGRRIRVDDAGFFYGVVHAHGHLFHPFGIALIAFQRWVHALLLHPTRRLLQEPDDVRMVRRHVGRQQNQCAVPLVVRTDCHTAASLRDFFAVHGEGVGSGAGLDFRNLL